MFACLSVFVSFFPPFFISEQNREKQRLYSKWLMKQPNLILLIPPKLSLLFRTAPLPSVSLIIYTAQSQSLLGCGFELVFCDKIVFCIFRQTQSQTKHLDNRENVLLLSCQSQSIVTLNNRCTPERGESLYTSFHMSWFPFTYVQYILCPTSCTSYVLCSSSFQPTLLLS